MSGVEAVSVALGALPVAVQMLEWYKNACRTVKQWRELQPSFVRLDGDLARQKSRMWQNAYKMLLCLDLSEQDIENMLDNPGNSAWTDESFQREFETYFKDDYQSYLKTMTGLHQALQDFETTLQVDDKKKEQILKTRSQQQCLSQSSNPIQHFLNIDWSLEFQKFRISSRIKKLRKAVTEIKTRLDELESLLRNDEELRQRIKIREASKSGSIKASRRKGAVLHSFLTKQWPCSCQSPHDSARVYLKRKAISEDQVGPSVAKKTMKTACDAEWEIATLVIYSGKTISRNLLGPFACVVDVQNLSESSASHKAKVRFQEPNKSRKVNPNFAAPLSGIGSIIAERARKDLCANLATCLDRGNEIGMYLQDASQVTIEHRPSPVHHQVTCLNHTTLHEILSNHSSHLSTTSSTPSFDMLPLARRIVLALDIASSFFYIVGTPWWSEQSKYGGNVLIRQQNTLSGVFYDAVIEQTFPKYGSSPLDIALDVPSALLELAICLEEICFGAILTQQGCYENHLGPDRRPHSYTNYCAARAWAANLKGLIGEDAFKAVSICLGKSQDVDNTILSEVALKQWQEIHDAIVEPLRRMLKQFVSVDQIQ